MVMNFEEKYSRERAFENRKESREDKLRDLLGELGESLQREDIPVDKNCRIDMDYFDDVYPLKEIERDKSIVRRWEEKWFGNWPAEEIERRKSEKQGFKLEAIKTLIFHKFIGKDFLVVRTSPYDDIENKIDNLILEKKTGSPVCAYDEVIGGRKIFEAKKEKVLEENKQGGVGLKYGIRIEKGRIQKGKFKNIPIFYLGFPRQYFKEAIEKISPSLEEKSDYERKIFAYFVSLMDSQIKELRLKSLPKAVTKRIDHFEQLLSKMK